MRISLLRYVLWTGAAISVMACHHNSGGPEIGDDGGGGDGGGGTVDAAPGGSGGITAWCAAHASSGGSAAPGSGALSFSVDLCGGPARQYDPPAGPTAVSPYVYGINAGSFVGSATKFGLIRQGGDDDSAYNWTNDYSNSGGDYCYFEGASTNNANLAGRYTDPTGDTIPAALAKGEAFLATIPILDYVAAAYDRNTGWDSADDMGDACPGTDTACSSRSGTDRANVVDKFDGDPGEGSPLAFAYTNGSNAPSGSPAFVHNVASKGSPFCSCPTGTTSCSGCSVGTNPVAEDEFVNFLAVNYGSNAKIFFDLDNEPNYWIGTHPELYPNDCSAGTVTWDDVAVRDLATATAIKAAWAQAKTFGPVVAGDGMAYGGDYASPHFVAGTTEFSDWYLQQVAAASQSAGKQLLDVFDVHYYTTGGTDAECLESPRLFWDPNATDISATETNNLDFQYGDHSYWDQYWYPRQVIPRLFGKIATAYGAASPRPALSFSEYNAGCEAAISGGVAEADLLGIFGREGVFSASAWPLDPTPGAYLVAAYALYRNYDGAGAVVGDTAVHATTSDSINTSVYAFVHADDAAEAELVAINKQATAQAVTIQIASSPAFATATLYHLVDGAAAVVADTGTAPALSCASNACTVSFTMPATSATTLVLR